LSPALSAFPLPSSLFLAVVLSCTMVDSGFLASSRLLLYLCRY
jgi:hypothetical protein